MPGQPMTEEQKRKKKGKVEEVTPQILFLDTKPFVISTDVLFQVDSCSGMKVEFLFSTGIK